MTTIRDVAARARVSVSTVSHVINSTRFVDPVTEDRVREAIEALGYRPNSLARSLWRRGTSTIGLLLPENFPFFADVAQAIEDAGFQQGYSVILCNADGSEAKEKAYIEVLLSKQVDGLLYISSGSPGEPLLAVLEAGVPVVVLDREVEGIAVDHVLVDNEQGGYLAGQYLIELGHRRIGCIAGPSNVALSVGRLAGFRRALAEVGVELPPDAVVHCEFQYESGVEAMQELVQRHLNLTAVFAANDQIASGAINALYRAHYRVPDDVSVIGFDNTKLAETMLQPTAQMGHLSVSLLLEQIRKQEREPSRILLPTTLIERESCRAILSPTGVEIDAMKKTGVLHNQLSQVIASMGHTDMLVISDAGLPVPPGVPCIDLAVTAGLPAFLDVLRAVATELQVERLIISTELQERNKTLPAEIQALFANAKVEAVDHEAFKVITAKARAVVRTGECTPYANVILCSGVTF
jgi:LacI family transcriptional regulator